MARRKAPIVPDELVDQPLAGRDPQSALGRDGLIDELKRALADREWRMPPREWAMAKAQLAILFDERFRTA